MNKYERGTTDSSMPQDLIKISQECIPKYIVPCESQAYLLEAKEGCGYRITRRKVLTFPRRLLHDRHG